MKKILFCVAVALTMISCLDGSFTQSYTADVTFECSSDVYANSFKDSLFVVPEGEGFVYMNYPLVFMQKQLAGTYQGGFIMSYLKGEADGKLDKAPAENDAYRVHSLMGASGSSTYAVYYENPVESMRPKYDIEFGYKGLGECAPLGCYVNNTTLVARKIKEHFKDGDTRSLRMICGDTRDCLALLKARSIHLMVTDIPYGVPKGPAGKQDSIGGTLGAALSGWHDVLKPGGSVCAGGL